MFENIKKLFKHKEVKRIPGVHYVEVNRVPIKRVNPARTDKLLRMRYTDTGETVEMPASDAINEVMGTMRPVVIMGFVE